VIDTPPTPGRDLASVRVHGTGSAAVAPDRVTVRLGVDIVRPDPGQAFRDAAASVTRLLEVLGGLDIDPRWVRTVDIGLGPRHHHRPNGQTEMVGYGAGHRLVVALPTLDGVERMLSEVVDAVEGVQLEGVTLSPTVSANALVQARTAAFDEARRQAEHWAELAGRTLGAVLSVDEGGHDSGPRMPRGGSFALAAAGGMPVAAGDEAVTVGITVVWELT
jgi:uncharacterized protein YggE